MTTLDLDKIAKRLGAVRRGTVTSRGGYFGALQLAAEVQARFHVPARGVERPILSGPNDLRGEVLVRQEPGDHEAAPSEGRPS